MNENQRKVVESCSAAIIEDLKGVAEIFSNHLIINRVMSDDEKQHIGNTTTTDTGKLHNLLRLLSAKENGWDVLISYLEKNNFGVAKTLKDSLEQLRHSAAAAATARPAVSTMLKKKYFIEEFKKTLIDYYISQYSKVRTMFGCNRDVDEIWVPLKLEEKTRSPIQTDHLSHFDLLKRLADKGSNSVALVKGQPGVGKTTLVQKIAYDWATDKVDQFDLILTVPLRYVGKTADFLELAADYYTNHLRVLPGCKEELLKWLEGLGKKLLIGFDGLDEYGSWAESPFKPMFTHSFKQSRANNNQCSIPFLPYKLLITSRPYACEYVNGDFSPIRFEISPLDEAHLADFVQHYCETDDGKMKVRKYLKEHSDLVINVPLILTFVCYLADLREEIPANLTLLYEIFLFHMVKREIQGNKLTEKFKADQWRESAVVKWTAQLAFEGCTTNKFEFRQSLVLDVAKDSFACGFLLHKFNFHEERLKAEFPHRSVQEFFAGLYCYQLTSTTAKSERHSVMVEILNGGNQFGRFFFGLCSVERKKFEEMLDWLNPTFGDVLTLNCPFDLILPRLSDCLSDCSEAELFGERLGERLAASLDQLENQIQKEREVGIGWTGHLSLPLSNRRFQSGLNLNGTVGCWSISHVDQPRWSRLTYVWADLHVDLREKFDKIQILRWGCAYAQLAGMISSLDLLPEVSTLIISTGFPSEVNFHLQYETTTTTAPTAATTQLRHFCFQFDKADIEDLKEKFKDQLDADRSIIGESHKTGKRAEISWVTVTVKKSFDRSYLLRILISLAFEIVSSPASLPNVVRSPVPYMPSAAMLPATAENELWASSIPGEPTLQRRSRAQFEEQSFQGWNTAAFGHPAWDSYQRQMRPFFPASAFGPLASMQNFGFPTMTSPDFSPTMAWPPAAGFPPSLLCMSTPVVLRSTMNPANFSSEHMTSDGRTFYFNQMTGESMWKQS